MCKSVITAMIGYSVTLVRCCHYRSDTEQSTAGVLQLLQEEHHVNWDSQGRSSTEGQLPR